MSYTPDPRDPKHLGIPNINFSLVSDRDKREEKFSKQRLERGFDESETWSLCNTFAAFMIPRLEEFMEIEKEVNAEPMTDELESIIKAMKLIQRDEGSWIWTDEESEAVKSGLQSLADNFLGMWW